MISRRLLYLNTHRLSAYAWRQGSLHPEGAFEAGEDDLARFAGYLAEHRRSHFYMLANVAEEGHVLESIPYLHGRDRKTVVARKTAQHFPGTPLTAAISLGYEKTQRKNEKLLLSALTDPGHFAPWLQALKQAEVPLAGLYTVAQLGGQLLARLGYGKGRCLLLSAQDHSIRETFLSNGQALFSRMAPLADSSIAGTASAFAAEAGKLQQYLVGQRLVGRQESLPVFVVAHPQAIPAIEKASPELSHLEFSIIDSHAAAHRLKLKTAPDDNRSDYLFMHLLATAAPARQFAGEEERHDYRLAQIRQGLIGLGLVGLLGSALFAAKETYRAYDLRQESQALSASEADLNWRYQEISATFPQLGIDNETLRRLTDRHAGLRRQQRQPAAAYLSLSRALDQAPDIELESLDWSLGTASPGKTLTLAGDEENTVVQGSIRTAHGHDPRQILNVLERFVGLLRADPANTVTVTQSPYDTASARTLRGGDGEDEQLRTPRFALRITRKLGP